MLQCTPPLRRVVIFHFHSFEADNEKHKYTKNTVIMKHSDTFVLDTCESNVDKKC